MHTNNDEAQGKAKNTTLVLRLLYCPATHSCFKKDLHMHANNDQAEGKARYTTTTFRSASWSSTHASAECSLCPNTNDRLACSAHDTLIFSICRRSIRRNDHTEKVQTDVKCLERRKKNDTSASLHKTSQLKWYKGKFNVLELCSTRQVSSRDIRKTSISWRCAQLRGISHIDIPHYNSNLCKEICYDYFELAGWLE